MDAREPKPRLNRFERLVVVLLGAWLAIGLWQTYGVLLYERSGVHVG
jgi:hypothetical protein